MNSPKCCHQPGSGHRHRTLEEDGVSTSIALKSSVEAGEGSATLTCLELGLSNEFDWTVAIGPFPSMMEELAPSFGFSVATYFTVGGPVPFGLTLFRYKTLGRFW